MEAFMDSDKHFLTHAQVSHQQSMRTLARIYIFQIVDAKVKLRERIPELDWTTVHEPTAVRSNVGTRHHASL